MTYAGYGDEIPPCYECEVSLFADELKLWTKQRDYDPAQARASYRGSPC